MASLPKSQPNSKRSSSTPIVRGLILLLGGYLLGTTAAHAVSPATQASSLTGGAIALAAYVVLESVARQKQAVDSRRDVHNATVRLEQRMEQHARLFSIHTAARLRSIPRRPHEQYLTVVRSTPGPLMR